MSTSCAGADLPVRVCVDLSGKPAASNAGFPHFERRKLGATNEKRIDGKFKLPSLMKPYFFSLNRSVDDLDILVRREEGSSSAPLVIPEPDAARLVDSIGRREHIQLF